MGVIPSTRPTPPPPTTAFHKTTVGGVFKAAALVRIQMSAAFPFGAPVAINTLITSNGNFHHNI